MSKKCVVTPSTEMDVLAVILTRLPSDKLLDKIEIELSWQDLQHETSQREIDLEEWMDEEEDRHQHELYEQIDVDALDYYDSTRTVSEGFYLHGHRCDHEGWCDKCARKRNESSDVADEGEDPIYLTSLDHDDPWGDPEVEDRREEIDYEMYSMATNCLPCSQRVR